MDESHIIIRVDHLEGWLVPKTTVIDAIDSFNNPAAFIILEISPLAGSTGVKLEGATMLEADSSVILGGNTQLGGSRLIRLENCCGDWLETGFVLGAGACGTMPSDFRPVLSLYTI